MKQAAKAAAKIVMIGKLIEKKPDGFIGKVTLINKLGIIVCLLLAAASYSFAQQRDPKRGFQASNSYAAGNFDAVNVNNGNVIVNLPLASLPAGRGTAPGFTVTLQYNSKIWDSKQTNYSNHLQQGHGDLNDTSGDYFYSANRLQLSDRGGWKIHYYYQLIESNRIDLASPDPCNGGDINDYNARWKLEMEMPDGSVKQFVPVFNSLKNKDGYYDVNSNGTRYNYLTQTTPGGICYVGGGTVQMSAGGMTYMTTDGSRLRLFVPYHTAPQYSLPRNWTMYSPDGTVIEDSPADDSSVMQRITDRNSNKIEIKGNQIVDQLGRSITIDGNDVTFKGVDGENVTTQIVGSYRWVYRKYQAIEYNPDQNIPQGTEYFDYVREQIQTIDQVILPAQAGGQTYSFDYYADATQQAGTNYTNGWGELKSVTLPSGAKSTYSYITAEGTDSKASEVVDNHAAQRDMTYTDSYDGVDTPRTETTYYEANSTLAYVHYPQGGNDQEFFHHNMYVLVWNEGLAYQSTYHDGSAVQRTWKLNLPYYANNTYNSYQNSLPPNSNAYVKAEFSSGPGRPPEVKDFNYDKNGNVTKITEYECAPTCPVTYQYGEITGIPSNAVAKRITVNTYYNQAPDADSTVVSSVTYENPNSPKLKNVIKSTEVQDANGTPVARSEFFYDDPNNKGNLTETKIWDSTKGALLSPDATGSKLNSSNSISTTTQYDSYGNPVLTTDAKGNQTQITYGAITTPTGTVSDLYPTQVISAYGTAIAQTAQSEYDFYTGLPKKVTALGNTASENVSSETIYDALGRPTKVATATGTAQEIWTQTQYDDLNRRVISRSDLYVKGDGKKVAVQHYDQLGRVFLSRMLEDSTAQSATNINDGIKVQTRYLTDNPFTYQLSSNPYRAATAAAASSEPSMGWTRGKTHYSGRYSEAETFAGASLPAPWGTNASSTGVVTTAVDADRTLVTDQSGKQRISRTNALGQMTDVWEVKESDSDTEAISFGTPATSLNGLKTSYSYDTLNNLTSVNQGQQTRSFSYSSLSRLLSAQNPESGAINYQYDNNGNLTQKTDARQVVANYVYDALNRVKNRNYSAPANLANYQTTPNVAYVYDGTGATVPFSKGKLTEVDNGVSKTKYTSFDVMGRVTGSQQITPGVSIDPQTYSYNLSGALIEEKYPSGRVVKNVLDNNGDLETVQSKKNQTSGFLNYARNFNYTAAGAVNSMQLGNGRWESTQFNSRLQPTQIALGTVQNGTDKLKLNYDYGTTANNGNVQSQTITTPSVGTNQGFSAVQTYTYDSLNRLKDAKENIDNQSNPSWKQTFTYDRYGNRQFDEANTNTLPKNCQNGSIAVVCAADVAIVNPLVDTTKNRLNGYTFDAAGNTTKDAASKRFTYDAENKQTKVETLDANNNPTSILGEYFYDGDGKRVKKVVGNEVTTFVYDAAGKLVAEYSNQTAGNQVSYLTSDNLGTPRINTDANGNITARHDYLPFGEEAFTAQRTNGLNYVGDSVRQGFTGYQKDDETDLDFAEARMYANRLGRFTTVDPIKIKKDRMFDPQRINLYVYVRNNPLMFVDVDGEDLLLVAKTEDEAKKKFGIYQKGFDSKDRSKVTLLVGNGKNGYKVGEFAVKIDAKAKGKDDNFKAAQTIANSDKRATLAVVSPSEKFQANFVLTNQDGTKFTDAGEMNVVAKEDFFGITLAPLPSDGKLNEGVYSTSANTEIYVASDQSDEEISATMHHEVTAHGEPAILGKPYGHSSRFSVDNVPKNDIDRKAIEAEKNARKNFKKP